MIRHLVYHVWPASRTDTWRRNLNQLIERLPLFNGRRRIGIAVDRHTEPAAAVQECFRGHDCEFLVVENCTQRGELQTFLPLLEPLKTDSEDEVILRAHAKGVRHGVYDPQHPVHRWTTILYETSLDYWPLVESSIEGHVFTGSFRRLGPFREDRSESACYSGSFYWMRSAAIFSRDWQNVEQDRYGAESYPGRIALPEECACIFPCESQNPYRRSEMLAIDGRYQAWRRDQSRFLSRLSIC